MPSLADLRRRIAVPRSALEQPAGTEESLVTDTRCRISPIQAVESKATKRPWVLRAEPVEALLPVLASVATDASAVTGFLVVVAPAGAVVTSRAARAATTPRPTARTGVFECMGRTYGRSAEPS